MFLHRRGHGTVVLGFRVESNFCRTADSANVSVPPFFQGAVPSLIWAKVTHSCRRWGYAAGGAFVTMNRARCGAVLGQGWEIWLPQPSRNNMCILLGKNQKAHKLNNYLVTPLHGTSVRRVWQMNVCHARCSCTFLIMANASQCVRCLTSQPNGLSKHFKRRAWARAHCRGRAGKAG